MGRLEGKVTIVTGATSGMGRRTAERFVDGGRISGRLWTSQQQGLRHTRQAFGLPAEG